MVDTTKKEVTDLNAGWYNVVSDAMGLDQTTFQLTQGTLGLQTSDSSGLFLMSDAVPPSASVAFYDPSGLSKRSSAYQLLLSALLPESGSGLRAALGDKYAGWIAYRDGYFTKNADSNETQEQVFDKWANQRLDPRRAAAAINAFKQASNALLNQALDALHGKNAKEAFISPNGDSFSLYKYSASVSAAQQAVKTGDGPTTISFDSSTMNTTLKHTTANGAASGFYDIFSGGASASFDQLNTTAASQRITITGKIDKYGTLSTDPIEWFTSGEYTRAYNAKNDNNVWDPLANAGSWDSFFAQPNGSLARRVSQLFLVSGYEITVTSHATYSESDCQEIQNNAKFGVWPFFSASASFTKTSKYFLNQDTSLSVTHKLNPGLIEIWGVTVQDAPN